MSTLIDVVYGEVIISGRGSDVAWEALRQLGATEAILSAEHMNRCYRHIRIWKEYQERFGPPPDGEAQSDRSGMGEQVPAKTMVSQRPTRLGSRNRDRVHLRL